MTYENQDPLVSEASFCQGLLPRSHYKELNSKAKYEIHTEYRTCNLMLIFWEASCLLLLVVVVFPLTLLPLVAFPKDSKAEFPDTFMSFNYLESCFPLLYSVCLEFLEHLLHHHYGPQMPSGIPISRGRFRAEIVWSEVTLRLEIFI